MNRTRWILLGVIAVELIAGGVIAIRRLREATPPKPDLALFDPITASQLLEAGVACETPELSRCVQKTILMLESTWLGASL